MILFALACEAGHRFEAWFRRNDAFDEQVARGLVQCSTCGSRHVAKTIMAPAVLGVRTPAMPTAGEIREPRGGALLDERRREARAVLKVMRDAMLAKGHDVGDRFPEEARRIHDGDSPARQIHGRATPEQARDLIEDGIMILPIPTSPEELN